MVTILGNFNKHMPFAKWSRPDGLPLGHLQTLASDDLGKSENPPNHQTATSDDFCVNPNDPCIGPQTGGRPIYRPQLPRQLRRGAGPPRFRRISPLAAPSGPGVVCKQRFKPGGSSGLDSQLLATILNPFPTIFGLLGRALYLNI